MKLMHYAAAPLTLDRDRAYKQRQLSTFGKPVGFWVSVEGEDDWPSWCRGEDFRLGSLVAAHEVELAANANILYIETPEDIDAFHVKYAVVEHRYRSTGRESWGIDWTVIVAEFDGIVIAPYQWTRRMSPDWYYGWDCASGCVWNLNAIAAVHHLAQVATR
jgi:hypothetical protein